jgi:hypothetical protein
MVKTTCKSVTAVGLVLVAAILAACSGGPSQGDPRSTVMSFFGAMEKNDQAALAHLLDLGELMKDTESDYALAGDSARLFTNPQDVLNDLTNGGKTKERWFSYQRIVASSETIGDHATVEVSFVPKRSADGGLESNTGYMTKFGLHKVNGDWKIYSFKTFDEPGVAASAEE